MEIKMGIEILIHQKKNHIIILNSPPEVPSPIEFLEVIVSKIKCILIGLMYCTYFLDHMFMWGSVLKRDFYENLNENNVAVADLNTFSDNAIG